jgi:DNA gyrase subunit B
MGQNKAPQGQVYRPQLSDVRKRPGMFIGSTDVRGLHNMIEEVISCGLSEVHKGNCSQIAVTLAADGSATVAHDGQGLPGFEDAGVGLITLERALAEYPWSPLPEHGSLLYAINALSVRLSVEVRHDGTIYRQSYKAGVPEAPAEALGPTSSQGLRITFLPDPSILVGKFSYEMLETRLRELAFLHPGLHCTQSDERPGHLQHRHFQFKDGLVAFSRFLEPDYGTELTDPIEITGLYETGNVSAVLHFFDAQPTIAALYANDHATPHGGTGLDGLLLGTVRLLNRIGRAEGVIMDTYDDLCRHDVVLGLTVILNVHLDAVEYGGNIRSWVENPELAPQVQWLVERQLGAYLTEHPREARQVIEHCLAARRLTNHQLPWH